MAATGSSIDVLYSCTNCHNKFKLDELSQNQQLCKACRKKFRLVPCKYCHIDFHQTNSLSIEDECDMCQKEFKLHGEPSKCTICNLPAAFKGPLCVRCAHSKKKYGSPVTCENCKVKCAFRKSSEAKKKVNGKTLCLLCTMNYKKSLFKRKTPHSQQITSTSKRSKLDTSRVTAAIGSLSSYSSAASITTTHSTSEQSSVDPLASGLVQENEKLKSELASLKKLIASKDQLLLEKDKQICSLKAENLEREKDFRIKTNTQQRQFNEQSEQLKMDIQSLKKQLASAQSRHKTKHPTTSSNNSAAAADNDRL